MYVTFNPASQLWDYYKVKIEGLVGKFIRIETSPNILADGFLCYDGKCYPSTKRDIIRRKVYADPAITEEQRPPVSTSNGATSNSDQPGPDPDDWLEECQAANLSWEEQIRALQML